MRTARDQPDPDRPAGATTPERPDEAGRPRAARQVIFVQGTAFSGSTMLHLMLANDPHGFACGEVHTLFRPHKPSHVNRRCSCGDAGCPTWPGILPAGRDRLYRAIFDRRPEVDFIVDSSKKPFWTLMQQRNLRAQGIPCHNLLIWKTPLELAASMKRRRQPHWRRVWLNTHRLCLTCMPGLRTVRYRQLTTDPQTLPSACACVGIPHFAGKEAYWGSRQCIVDGSTTAKYHVYDQERAAALYATAPTLNREIAYRTITYRAGADAALAEEVAAAAEGDPMFARLTRLLEAADVANPDYDPVEVAQRTRVIRMPRHLIELRRAKYHWLTLVGAVRYRNTPRFAPTGPLPT